MCEVLSESHSLAPDAHAPDVLAPDVLAPDVLAPEVLAPHVLAPDVLAPEVLAPAVLAPDVLSPNHSRCRQVAREPVAAHTTSVRVACDPCLRKVNVVLSFPLPLSLLCLCLCLVFVFVLTLCGLCVFLVFAFSLSLSLFWHCLRPVFVLTLVFALSLLSLSLSLSLLLSVPLYCSGATLVGPVGEEEARVVTETAVDVTVGSTDSSLRRTGRATRQGRRRSGIGQAGGDWWWIYHPGCRGEGSSCRWCSSHRVRSNLARRYISEWADRAGG